MKEGSKYTKTVRHTNNGQEEEVASANLNLKQKSTQNRPKPQKKLNSSPATLNASYTHESRQSYILGLPILLICCAAECQRLSLAVVAVCYQLDQGLAVDRLSMQPFGRDSGARPLDHCNEAR